VTHVTTVVFMQEEPTKCTLFSFKLSSTRFKQLSFHPDDEHLVDRNMSNAI